MVKFGALADARQKIILKQYLADFCLGFTTFCAPLDALWYWY
jgi:hypothetical protein